MTINEIYTDLLCYLRKYALSVYSCAANAEDVTQEVLTELVYKLDTTRTIEEMRFYARDKMSKFMLDKYRQAKSTGINFIHEYPAEADFIDYAIGTEVEAELDKKKQVRLKNDPDLFLIPDTYRHTEFSILRATFMAEFKGKTRDIFMLITSDEYINRENNSEIAEILGCSRQYVEMLINTQIKPKILDKLVA